MVLQATFRGLDGLKIRTQNIHVTIVQSRSSDVKITTGVQNEFELVGTTLLIGGEAGKYPAPIRSGSRVVQRDKKSWRLCAGNSSVQVSMKPIGVINAETFTLAGVPSAIPGLVEMIPRYVDEPSTDEVVLEVPEGMSVSFIGSSPVKAPAKLGVVTFHSSEDIPSRANFSSVETFYGFLKGSIELSIGLTKEGMISASSSSRGRVEIAGRNAEAELGFQLQGEIVLSGTGPFKGVSGVVGPRSKVMIDGKAWSA